MIEMRLSPSISLSLYLYLSLCLSLLEPSKKATQQSQ
jgi:hypothetical protein